LQSAIHGWVADAVEAPISAIAVTMAVAASNASLINFI
jgi:hypothetical protein